MAENCTSFDGAGKFRTISDPEGSDYVRYALLAKFRGDHQRFWWFCKEKGKHYDRKHAHSNYISIKEDQEKIDMFRCLRN